MPTETKLPSYAEAWDRLCREQREREQQISPIYTAVYGDMPWPELKKRLRPPTLWERVRAWWRGR